MNSADRLLPPRKKNWKEGTPQIGVAYRTKEGGYVEMVKDCATDDDVAFVMALILGLKGVPRKIIDDLKAALQEKPGK